MFMDKQELKYSLKFIKGDLKQRSVQILTAIIILVVSSSISIIMNCLSIISIEDNFTNIVSFQDFSYTALIASVIFPLVLYVLVQNKTTMSSLIYPQTNNTRFVKDVTIGITMVLLLVLGYVISYLFGFLAGFILSLTVKTTFVVSKINLFDLLLTCFSLFMYGTLAIAFFTLMGAVIRKIKLYSLVFVLILGVLLTKDFFATIKSILKIAQFYIFETSVAMFALKVLTTVVVMLILAYIINNKTFVENNINYKNKAVIIAIGCSVFAVILVSGLLFNLVSEDISIGGMTPEPDVNIEQIELKTIEIDVSDIPKGTVLSAKYSGIYDYSAEINNDSSTYEPLEMRLENYNRFEQIKVTGDTLVVSYMLSEAAEELNFNLHDYTKEKLIAYVEDETLYLDYQIEKNVNLININSSFIINQFDVVEEKSEFMSYTYISPAYCMLEFK